jgi:hypothetical protein
VDIEKQPTVVLQRSKILIKAIDLINFLWYNLFTTDIGERYEQSIEIRKEYKKISQAESYDTVRARGEDICNTAERIEMGERIFVSRRAESVHTCRRA